MQHTEHHKEVTIRIDDFTTITLSDEMGGLGSFIEEKLSKVKNVFEAHELLIKVLQESLAYHQRRKNSIFYEKLTDEEYTNGLRQSARRFDVYVEGEV